MKRRIFALLLAWILVLAVPTSVFAAKETEEAKLLDVAVTVYGNKTGIETVNGLYEDNIFYISGADICKLSGAKITDQDNTGIAFSLHGGLRAFAVYATGKVTESHSGKKVELKMPAISHDGQIYISAPDILRYIGATVYFGADENAQLHMMVSMPYTVLDLVVEYAKNSYTFSWSEAVGKWMDPEDVLELAALDTIIFGYDSNVVAYMLPGYGENVENDIHTDALLELLRTEGTELSSQEDVSVEILSYLSDYTEVSIGFIEKTLEWVAESDLEKELAEKWGKRMDAAGLVVDMTAGCISSIETVKQFANMSTSQKTLMEKTLCRVKSSSELYKEYPAMFSAASDAGAMMRGEYTASEKAAWDGVYNLLGNAVEAIIPPNPITFAWDSLTGIAKLDPLIGKLLQAEANITFASECSDIQYLAKRLYDTDAARFDSIYKGVGKTDTTDQEYLKYDILLRLKAALTARLLLIDTNWLTEEAQTSMESKTQKIAVLLNKAQNARAVPIGTYELNEEDISWIENLACRGGMGNVVTIGENTYFWRYSANSFAKDGFSDFSLMDTTNDFVCMDQQGKIKTLFSLQSHGEFVIAGNQLFYEGPENKICSIGLDGKNKHTWGEGSLCCVTRDGKYVIYQGYQGSAANQPLYAINVAKGTESSLTSANQFVTYFNGVIYYTTSTWGDAAQMGQLTLWRIDPDGSNKQKLHTTAPDLYSSAAGYSLAMVDHIRFTKDHIYFSYGSVAGSGSFFQGGKVIRVGYDGTGGKVVAGQNDLVGGQFTVEPDGTVNAYYPKDIGSYIMGYPLEIADGYISILDQANGKPQIVVKPGDYGAAGPGKVGTYGDSGTLLVKFAEVHNGKVYYMIHYAVPNPDVNVWWASNLRERTTMMVKDLETGKVTTIFRV